MNDTALIKQAPRSVLTQETIEAMFLEMRAAIDGAHELDYFDRMELNHDARHCWWPGQTKDGRKWAEGRKTMPGQKPNDVFPWPGASDARVPIVEEIIQERVMFKRVAHRRGQTRIGPRNLSPDDDPQAKAALWGQTAEYYQDTARDNIRAAAAQLADISEEYGAGILFITWATAAAVVAKEISADDIFRLAAQAAMQRAMEEAEAAGQELGEEQQSAILAMVEAKISELILDPEMQPMLANVLMQYDPAMRPSEARRVAGRLKLGEPVQYHAAEPKPGLPEWRAMTPFVDIWFPATTTRIKDAPWVAISEWLTEVELRERIETEGYNREWVTKVLEKPGRALSFEDSYQLAQKTWILANGGVRQAVTTSNDPHDQARQKLYQVLHVFWKASAIGGAPALYHSVLHEQVKEMAGFHTCCEHAHGEFPFVDHLREQTATYILASRGVGEVTFTMQNEVKAQHDGRTDAASITIKPPMRVPLNMAGGSLDVRPGSQLPMRATAGMGMLEPLRLGIDPRGSQEIEQATRDQINAYWFRGANVEPDVKIAWRQQLVDDWLADIRKGQLMTFQLIQQFAPATIKSAFVGGLPVELSVSREEIQGQVSIEMDFDVADLDPGLIDNRIKAITALKSLDTENLLPLQPLLKAMAAYLLPSHYRFLVANPAKQAIDEAADERRIIGDILNGMEPAYVPGQNHGVRLEEMKRVFGMEIDKEGNVRNVQPVGQEGTMSKPQKLAMSDPDVAALVQNRLKFHAFQLQQQENAGTGRTGVEPIREAA